MDQQIRGRRWVLGSRARTLLGVWSSALRGGVGTCARPTLQDEILDLVSQKGPGLVDGGEGGQYWYAPQHVFHRTHRCTSLRQAGLGLHSELPVPLSRRGPSLCVGAAADQDLCL